MIPPEFDDDQDAQEATSIMLLQVALRLLGEARLRGDFGDEAELTERAAALADEFTDGAPSPDPRRPLVTVGLLRPDRITLSAPFEEDAATAWSLMLDGTLYDGMTVGSVSFVNAEPEELSDEERADLERRRAESQVRRERMERFTATRFVRAVAAPPGAPTRVLAALLYEDGFYVESTRDEGEPEALDPEMDAERLFARFHGEDPEIAVEDDVGTEYFPSGGGGERGVRVSHSSRGFAPAPPAAARVLRITAGGATFELDLRP